jgi:hypothetical protein
MDPINNITKSWGSNPQDLQTDQAPVQKSLGPRFADEIQLKTFKTPVLSPRIVHRHEEKSAMIEYRNLFKPSFSPVTESVSDLLPNNNRKI